MLDRARVLRDREAECGDYPYRSDVLLDRPERRIARGRGRCSGISSQVGDAAPGDQWRSGRTRRVAPDRGRPTGPRVVHVRALSSHVRTTTRSEPTGGTPQDPEHSHLGPGSAIAPRRVVARPSWRPAFVCGARGLFDYRHYRPKPTTCPVHVMSARLG